VSAVILWKSLLQFGNLFVIISILKTTLMKRKPKVKPEEVSLELPPFHIAFPITLKYKEGKVEKVCYFSCKEHLQSHITRHKLKKDQVTITKTGEKNYGID